MGTHYPRRSASLRRRGAAGYCVPTQSVGTRKLLSLHTEGLRVMSGVQTTALNSSVLVLNRQYMAIHVVGVRRAFGLLINRLAEVIHIRSEEHTSELQSH